MNARDRLLDLFLNGGDGSQPEFEAALDDYFCQTLYVGADAIDGMEKLNAWPVRPVDARTCSDFLRQMGRGDEEKATVTPAATATPELLPAADAVDPLIVDRFDVVMEPAPEDEPVLIVGAIAEDGRPVALLFDPEARAKVAAWLAPAPARSSRERRLEQLLDTIRTHGGRWTTRRVQDMRRRRGHSPQRGTARRDLADLHRRGHLTEHGPDDGRFYTLATREDRRHA
ncbi:hypothetical protein [Streptomyces alfalfae]|uniref:hypothetical protein n=1 Tax=Streptomyces alfalfae TaxID=1642299 RepID=UPI00281144AC|nr:hypothetical protein [Streptomyces alfalfae]